VELRDNLLVVDLCLLFLRLWWARLKVSVQLPIVLQDLLLPKKKIDSFITFSGTVFQARRRALRDMKITLLAILFFVLRAHRQDMVDTQPAKGPLDIPTLWVTHPTLREGIKPEMVEFVRKGSK
jgi:hypothetical protein